MTSWPCQFVRVGRGAAIIIGMASRTTVTLIDDLDGSTGEISTVSVSLDGHAVELDLSQANYDKLQQALAPYLAAGRKTRSTSTRSRRSSAPVATGDGKQQDAQAIREWAEANGHQVSSRGRVKKEIVDAYQAAHA